MRLLSLLVAIEISVNPVFKPCHSNMRSEHMDNSCRFVIPANKCRSMIRLGNDIYYEIASKLSKASRPSKQVTCEAERVKAQRMGKVHLYGMGALEAIKLHCSVNHRGLKCCPETGTRETERRGRLEGLSIGIYM